MPLPRAPWPPGLLALAAATALASCGGGTSVPAAVSPTLPDAVPASPTTLALSAPQLGMRVSGHARTLTLTNTGWSAAESLTLAPEVLPLGIRLSGSTCGASLAPGDSCNFTFTPGATPTATPGDHAPAAALVEISGSNTNTASVSLHVIDYGSVHQGGYVFAIDDSTPVTGSIGGKVAALADLPSMVWTSSTGLPNTIPTINDISVLGTAGSVSGPINTMTIINSYASEAVAAAQCRNSSSGGFGNWYLPAICEMGYGQTGAPTSVCGTQGSPLLADNLQSRLVDNAAQPLLPPATRFSSTLWSGDPDHASVLTHTTSNLGGSIGTARFNVDQRQVRCVRTLTP